MFSTPNLADLRPKRRADRSICQPSSLVTSSSRSSNSSSLVTSSSRSSKVNEFVTPNIRRNVPKTKPLEQPRGGFLTPQVVNLTRIRKRGPEPQTAVLADRYRRRLDDEEDVQFSRMNIYFSRNVPPEHLEADKEFCTIIRKRKPRNKFVACPLVVPNPTIEQYQEYLDIYQRNQSFFRDYLEKGSIDEKKMQKIEEVDRWFGAVVEPRPIDPDEIQEWKDRETHRLNTRISFHKDPDLTRRAIFG